MKVHTFAKFAFALATLAMTLALPGAHANERPYVPGQILIGFTDPMTRTQASSHLRGLLNAIGHHQPFDLHQMTPRAIRIEFQYEVTPTDPYSGDGSDTQDLDIIAIAARLTEDPKIAFAHPNWLAEGIPGAIGPPVNFGNQMRSPAGPDK